MRRRRRLRTAIAASAVIALLVGTRLDAVTWGARIMRFQDPLVRSLDAPARLDQPVHILLVVSDSRQDIESLPGRFGSLPGKRADAIALLRVAEHRLDVLSIPRDLRVGSDVGDVSLAALLDQRGPAGLVREIRDLLAVPIHHYLELDFRGVAQVVNQLGGVSLSVPHALRDDQSGLALQAGHQRLDGAEAVAYLRARTMRANIEGTWVPLRTGDLGRIERLQHLIALGVTASKQLPLADALSVALAAVDAAARDATFSNVEALRLARRALGDAAVCLASLPVRKQATVDERTSPFAPRHLGARYWLLPGEGQKAATAPFASRSALPETCGDSR